MSSSAHDLPPSYQEKHPSGPSASGAAATATGIASHAQTCSIRDNQVDYLAIVRESATSYQVSITVNPTPLYRIEVVPSSTKVGDIQIFSASDETLPAIAAARIAANPKSKSEPLATMCTSSPTHPDALWRPLTRTGTFSVDDYKSKIPIVTVPGRPATAHQFSWRTGRLSEPFYQLWWEGPLPLMPQAMFTPEQRAEYIFATIARKTAGGGENLVEIRRGGGIEFELSVILELFVILNLKKEQLM